MPAQPHVVYLRELDAGTDFACWVVCAKGDRGAVEFGRIEPTPADLLSRLILSGEADGSRLVVMAQNPANNHHWSKAVGAFTAGEVRAALGPLNASQLPGRTT